MDKVNLTTHSEEETMAFGEWIGAHAVNDLFIALMVTLVREKHTLYRGWLREWVSMMRLAVLPL